MIGAGASSLGGLRTKTLPGGECPMRILMLPFTARFIAYTARDRHHCRSADRIVFLSIAHRRRGAGAVWRAGGDRHCRSHADAPCGAAQLSALRAHPFHPRGNPPGNAAVFSRKREGRHAVLPRQARDRLPARQDGAGQAAVRHPERRLRRGYEWLHHSIAPEAASPKSRSASSSAARIAPSPIRPRSSTFRR